MSCSLNRDVIDELGISDEVIRTVSLREWQELARRESLYRGSNPPPEVAGKTTILVDDGLATGSTMRAAISALKKQGPARIVVAVPVAATETCAQLGVEVNEVVCPYTPDQFYSVGLWYRDFSPTTDDRVRELLEAAKTRPNQNDPHDDKGSHTVTVHEQRQPGTDRCQWCPA